MGRDFGPVTNGGRIKGLGPGPAGLRSLWPTATPVVTQVSAGTFRVTEPSGRVDTVVGMRPVTTPGPWVITTVMLGALPAS